MIFSSMNEDGIPTWKLVMEGKKTVTRRTRPIEIGKILAVQPKRGAKAICHIKILKCQDDAKWQTYAYLTLTIMDKYFGEIDEEILAREAMKEGFHSWKGLWKWIETHYGKIPDKLYRIEFVKITNEEANP